MIAKLCVMTSDRCGLPIITMLQFPRHAAWRDARKKRRKKKDCSWSGSAMRCDAHNPVFWEWGGSKELC